MLLKRPFNPEVLSELDVFVPDGLTRLTAQVEDSLLAMMGNIILTGDDLASCRKETSLCRVDSRCVRVGSRSILFVRPFPMLSGFNLLGRGR